jgi:AraC-like DNA-binding protein
MIREQSADRLLMLHPPFRSAFPVAHALTLRNEPSHAGSVVVWVMSTKIPDEVFSAVRHRAGGVALVVILPPAEHLLRRELLYRMVQSCHPSVVLPFHDTFEVDDLVLLLREPVEPLGGTVTDYLTWRGLTIDPDTRRIVARALNGALNAASVADLARGMYLSRRALGRRFFTAGLPAPSRWLQIGRVLHASLRLQREATTLQAVARDFHCADGFALSNQMERLTGLRPSEVRRLAGWEWIFERWIGREVHRGGFRGPALQGLRRTTAALPSSIALLAPPSQVRRAQPGVADDA